MFIMLQISTFSAGLAKVTFLDFLWIKKLKSGKVRNVVFFNFHIFFLEHCKFMLKQVSLKL